MARSGINLDLQTLSVRGIEIKINRIDAVSSTQRYDWSLLGCGCLFILLGIWLNIYLATEWVSLILGLPGIYLWIKAAAPVWFVELMVKGRKIPIARFSSPIYKGFFHNDTEEAEKRATALKEFLIDSIFCNTSQNSLRLER